jgi:hypothetical protein
MYAMNKQTNLLSKLFLVPAVLSATLIACEPDNGMDNLPPAYHITKSEKLELPAALALPPNENGYTRVATYYAEGVQKYKAQVKAGSDPVTYEWVFVAPQADLYDITNKKIGTHSAGPTWQLSAMDSIYAQHLAPPRTAPSPDAGSIDWLLLIPKAGKTPTGIFAEVDYIHRIDTKGGKAPSQLPASANETAEVNYTAIYRFTKQD